MARQRGRKGCYLYGASSLSGFSKLKFSWGLSVVALRTMYPFQLYKDYNSNNIHYDDLRGSNIIGLIIRLVNISAPILWLENTLKIIFAYARSARQRFIAAAAATADL
ncbi:hypothetical protein TSAR_015717 [Trichomalopsis sarcophagae]|uniref:Uncharacterized protein n=1 Tax=Trichomalopsis sarcophagae TaxID=543379 RepID=A0A232FEL4_9HYME|nr:hypothetical protein TSAR_015717 [Trichomalopsis sarcophagae]